jgi:hypothetical protein
MHRPEAASAPLLLLWGPAALFLYAFCNSWLAAGLGRESPAYFVVDLAAYLVLPLACVVLLARRGIMPANYGLHVPRDAEAMVHQGLGCVLLAVAFWALCLPSRSATGRLIGGCRASPGRWRSPDAANLSRRSLGNRVRRPDRGLLRRTDVSRPALAMVSAAVRPQALGAWHMCC